MVAIADWLALAPKPRPRAENQKWDVFLSYRSVNRPWVIELYDVLTQLGYSVFLDQFVLTAAERLVGQLEEGLDASAAGVLVWSTASEDSEWCKKEYSSFETRESNNPNFHYVVAKLDVVKLPTFAAQKLFLDFTESREGPCGANLLRLLCGLRGEPLPPEAVGLAVEVDEQNRAALTAIRAARANGDWERLVELAASTSLAWQTSALLSCQAADALIALKRPDEALAVLNRVQGQFPRSVRPKQLTGLALARKKDWKKARQILGELYEAGERDSETVGLLARTWMDRYEETKDVLHLRKSRDLYAEAFASVPSDYYTGINAASKSVLLGEVDVAASLATKVEALVGTAAVSGDYWKTATVAEVQLIKGNFDAAGKLYAAAVAIVPDERGSHESTWGQARNLMEKLQPTDPQRAIVAKAFAHLQ